MFTRLTATSSDGTDTADRATRAELTEGRSPAEAEDVAAVLEAFAAERLLTLAADTVELSHEVLLTAWPLLRDTWLADTHADRIVRTRLHTTAADWARHARDPSYLYAGSLLAAAAETATRITADPARHPPLSQTERDFLHASERTTVRSSRRRRMLAGALVVLLIAAIAGAGIAAAAARNASQQRTIAVSGQLAGESEALDAGDPVTASRLAAAAWRIAPTAQARDSMLDALAQPDHGVLPVDTGGFTVTRWCSVPMARPWPPWAATAQPGCGTWPPTPSSGRLSQQGTHGGLQPRRQGPGHRELRRHGPAVGRSHSHRRSARRSAAATGRARWRSARTVRPWPPAAATARPGCGTWPPTPRSAHRSLPAPPATPLEV